MTELSLHEYPSYLVGQVSKAAQLRVGRILDVHDLRAPHLAVLVAVSELGAISQRELSDTLGIDKSHVVNLVDDLSARGLIRRRADAGDARRHQLVVTIAGRKLLPALSAQIERCQEEIFAALSPRELRQLASLLRRVLSAQRDEPGAVAATAVPPQRGLR